MHTLLSRLANLTKNLAEQMDRSSQEYRLTANLFLRGLAIIYAIAFLSLAGQVEGLIGSNGILPVESFLQRVHDQIGNSGYYRLPTILWLSSSDQMLYGLCICGAVAAMAAFALPLTTPLWVVLWIAYLSLYGGGQTFLSFQWDILLLESGFLAIFLSPWRWAVGIRRLIAPSITVVWLFRWLLFRLMFASGAVKLSSGDATWSDLTALNYHYFTQPLPPWTAWYLHHLPEWFHQFSVLMMFAIELAVPFLIFAPRRLRQWAAVPLVALQLLIIVSGNYGFFNVLSIILCLLLLDDRALRNGALSKVLQRFFPVGKEGEPAPATIRRPAWLRVSPALIGATLFLLLGLHTLYTGILRRPASLPVVSTLQAWQQPFHLVNGYGLFMVMTTERPEIVIEGSDDGINWKAYEFNYKPGILSRAPAFVAPHQPRLDWQMWFAALGSINRNVWLANFAVRLMEGEPEVVGLMAQNPFPEEPPYYLRAMLYQYRFTEPDESDNGGNWWKRDLQGFYLRPISRAQLSQLKQQLGM